MRVLLLSGRPVGKREGFRFVYALLWLFTTKGYRNRVKDYIVAGMNCVGGHPLGDPNVENR